MSNKEQAPVIIKFIFGVLGIGIVGYTISFYNYDESPVAFLSLVSMMLGTLTGTFNHLDMILIRKSRDLYFRNEVRSHLFFLPAVWVLAAPYNFILSIGIFSAILKEGQQLNSASFNKQFNGFFIAVYTAFLGISMLSNLFNEHPIEVPAFGEIFILVVGILMMYLLIQNIVDLSRNLRQREAEIKLLSREKSWYSDLFSLVSHNLRTPLTTVYNSFMIEELKKSEFSKTAQFSTVKMELDKILSIVDQSFRQNAWIKQEQRVLGDIKKFISEQYPDAILQSNEEPRYARLLLDSSEATALMLGLDSVLGNAFKYGGKNVIVSSNVFSKGAEVIISLSIADDGIGMTPEELKLYGTPFNTQSKKAGGSGLGVYFTHNLIKQLGWSIDAQSTAGEGTTITYNMVFDPDRIPVK